MSQRFLVFLMLASLFLARGLHASDFYYTKRVSIPEGLSQPNVTCIQTDSKGAVWIGTRYGLNAFRAGSIHHYLDKGGSNPPISGKTLPIASGWARQQPCRCSTARATTLPESFHIRYMP